MMANEAGQHFTISSSDEQRLPARGLTRRYVMIWLSVIFLAEMLASGITYPILLQRMQALLSSANSGGQVLSGQVRFLSSPAAPPGNIDEVQITMQQISAAPAGEQYYAWLQLSSENVNSIHWPLPAPNGTLPYTYTYTDPQHNNLLANNPHLFLITLETAGTPPLTANFDSSARRYYANLPFPIKNRATFDIVTCPQGPPNNICYS